MRDEITAKEELRAFLWGTVAAGMPQKVADSIHEFVDDIEQEAYDKGHAAGMLLQSRLGSNIKGKIEERKDD